MTDAPRKRAPRKRATSATAVAERADTLVSSGEERVPGTSLVMHRFPRGSLAGQPWIGADGIEVHEVHNAHREIAKALSVWTEDQKLKAGATGTTMFDRDAYVPPDNVFDQMQMARRAVRNDDIVGGLADGTEALSYRKIRWEAADLDDADVFNQWSARVNLDNFIRMCHRELFTYSQYVAARWWGFQDFRVRGNGPPKRRRIDPMTGEEVDLKKDDLGTVLEIERDPETDAIVKGNRRRKEYKGVYCPVGLTVLDSTRVVPLGSLLFGQEKLVWTATPEEMQVWQAIEEGKISRYADPIMASFFLGRYTPTNDERAMLLKLGVRNPTDLLMMNPDYVWRHTLTRPSYEPWADLRLKRTFRWLDLKQQAMAADRVALIGNANYILVVKKGEKDAPASQEELDDLNENFAYVARLPVVVGDHTLTIEIVAPKQDFTLMQERYDVLDQHIRDSILATLGGGERGRDDTSGDSARARGIAMGLTNVRHGVKRNFEAELARRIVDHPFNEGKFEDEPNLVFSPRAITLETDQAGLNALIALSARGDVSRQTTLEEALDLDQATEAQRREMEQLWYDPIFKTATPFNGNADPMQPDDGNANPAAGGPGNSGGVEKGPPGAGGGGRPPGGGKPKETPASPKAPRAPRAPRGKNRT